MSICCGCGSKFDFDTPGVLISAVSAQVSEKSGRALTQEDQFPDGISQKFICIQCLFQTEVARMLGFYNQSDDSDMPPEVLSGSTHMHRLPAPYLPWGQGYKP